VRAALAALALLAAAVWGVYGRHLAAPFIADDSLAVVTNDSIRRLTPLFGDAGGRGPLNPDIDLPVTARPLTNLSFALSYRAGGLDPRGYRVVNIALHTLAAWLLWAIARRAIRRGAADPACADAAGLLAPAIALLWAVHPLLTESVFYVTQRSELLVGVCYLAVLYASLRYWDAATPAPRGRWLAAAGLACLTGAACKEVIVTAPAVVLLLHLTLYRDRPPARSWPLYAALLPSWLMLLALQWDAPHRMSSGFGLGVSLADWWLTQAGVLLMYLKLAVYPWPLVVLYDLPWADPPAVAWAHAAAVAALALAALGLVVRRHWAGLLLGSALVILSPTHVVPMITEVAAERRMYLPLAALVALAVLAVHALLCRAAARSATAARPGRAPAIAACGLAATLAAVYGAGSIGRVAAFADPLALWTEVAAAQPHNARAQHNVAVELAMAGRLGEAIVRFRLALAARPGFAQSHHGLGMALLHTGALAEGIAHLETAARRDPGSFSYALALGEALLAAGRPADALAPLARALALAPGSAAARDRLAAARRLAGAAAAAQGASGRAMP
jgi:tetratricopeptide (TPR) repeat protein